MSDSLNEESKASQKQIDMNQQAETTPAKRGFLPRAHPLSWWMHGDDHASDTDELN